MSNRKEAATGVAEFLGSDDTVLLVIGTHQNEKLPLVVRVALAPERSPTTALFRGSTRGNVEYTLRRVVGGSGKFGSGPVRLTGGHRLYLDTFTAQTWRRSPTNVDLGILFPIDGLGYGAGEDCLADLRRRAEKTVLVSWTDNRDHSWIDQFEPVVVRYDAAEERPDYHDRVRGIENEAQPAVPQGLPGYANSTDPEYLVRFYCRRCNCSRLGRLNVPYPGKTKLRDAAMGEYELTCLRCGDTAHDNYNWYGR